VRWRDFWLVLIFRSTRSVAAGMLMIAFPYLILRVLHQGAMRLGLLYACGALGTAVLGLLLGMLGDIWSRRFALLAAGALLPLSSLIICLSHRTVWLAVAAWLGGFSATGSLAGGGIGGPAAPVQSAAIADITAAAKRTFYYSFFSFISGIFGALGALLARLWTPTEAFWLATFISAAGLPAVLGLGLPELRGRLRHLPSRSVIGKFSVTGTLNGLSQGLLVPFLVPFFVLVYALPRPRMAFYGFLAGTLASVALLTAPVLDRRLGFVRSIAWTRGIGTALVVLMPLVRVLPVSLFIYVLTPALRIAALPVQQAALTEMVRPEERGRALAANQVARLLASAAGIGLSGWLFGASRFTLPFLLYGVTMGTNVVLYFRFFGRADQARRARRVQHEIQHVRGNGE